jgi:ribonucleoside-diphosphate reductase alpha chain
MFKLNTRTVKKLKKLEPNFGYNGFGELVYYRTYSRVMSDGKQEQWADTVIRVIEGVFSIRKNYYANHGLPWHEKRAQKYAERMSVSLYRMEWLPPGRGLWCMGTDLIRARGAMPLYNCAFTEIGIDWINDLSWLMDLLMHGVGVGFEAKRDDKLKLYSESALPSVNYIIEDTREGWVDSVKFLLNRYLYGDTEPIFNYNFIRSAGQPLKTFGGTASGPGPLKELHERIRETCERYIYNEIDSVTFKTDLANQIGCCVVAGNIRRSAEIGIGVMDDPWVG